MARQQATRPAVAPSSPSSSRITKSRSEGSRPPTARARRRSRLLLAEASSSGVLQEMVNEVHLQDLSNENTEADDESPETASSGGVTHTLYLPYYDDDAGDAVMELTVVEDERGAVVQSVQSVPSASITEGEHSTQSAHSSQSAHSTQSCATSSECPILDKDERPFPIMDLPTEIRLEIYRACLTRPYNILLSKNERRLPTPVTNEKEAADSIPFLQQALNDAFDAAPSDEPNREDGLASPRDGTATPTNGHQLRRRRSYGDRVIASVQVRRSGRLSLANRPPSISRENSSGPDAQAGPSNPVVIQPPDTTGHEGHRVWLQDSTGTRIDIPPFMPYRPQSQDPLLVNLLLANKQIYKEARSVLYSENLFTLDLGTAISTLQCLHQRSRREIKHVELEIPTYNEILEKFQETVRLSLRYCSGLKKLIIHMPFTLPGADGSGTTGNTTVYANGFDILRWLPQQCAVLLRGNSCVEIDNVVNKHLTLAKTLDKLAYARRQLISSDNTHVPHSTPDSSAMLSWP